MNTLRNRYLNAQFGTREFHRDKLPTLWAQALAPHYADVGGLSLEATARLFYEAAPPVVAMSGWWWRTNKGWAVQQHKPRHTDGLPVHLVLLDDWRA